MGNSISDTDALLERIDMMDHYKLQRERELLLIKIHNERGELIDFMDLENIKNRLEIIKSRQKIRNEHCTGIHYFIRSFFPTS